MQIRKLKIGLRKTLARKCQSFQIKKGQEKTAHKTPLHGRTVTDWLCCTEGWHLKADGKWHETRQCGWKPDRVAEALDDVFNLYRK